MKTKTDTNPPILCVRCGGAGANVYGGGVWSHHFWSDCIEHLTARVTDAEALAAERLESALFAEQRATDAELECDDLRDANSVLSDALEKTRQALGAVTARAAELTTERNTTGRRAFNAEAENQRLAAENRRLAARVAELEAAQEWQSRSETPNAIDTYLVYRAAPPQNEPWRYDFAVWEDDGWDTEEFTHYRPLPPAPDVQEPTP